MRTTVFESAPLSVYDYRCTAGPGDKPFVEMHGRAKDNGAPGVRADYSPNYYAAFLIDLDGNNVEAVCMR